MQDYIYVVFSTTPYKVGAMIRKFTHSKYNHVSISFDDRLNEMYSFARLFINTPLYCGLVREFVGRFFRKDRYASLKICKIPVTHEQYVMARNIITDMYEHRQRYLYNYFSAISYMFNRRVNIPNAFTCIEFSLELLRQAKIDIGVKQGKCIKIQHLSKTLDSYKCYEGSIKDLTGVSTYYDKSFYEKKRFLTRMKLNFTSAGRLVKSLFTR